MKQVFFFFRILTLALQTYSARFRTGFSSCGVLSQIDLAQISSLSPNEGTWIFVSWIYHQKKASYSNLRLQKMEDTIGKCT